MKPLKRATTRPEAAKRPGNTVKVTMSLTPVIKGWAIECADKRGYNNFSAYIAELIRRDKEEVEERERKRMKSPDRTNPIPTN